jgi:hypothetical protein
MEPVQEPFSPSIMEMYSPTIQPNSGVYRSALGGN